MTGQKDSRAEEIKRRARKYRRKRENRSLGALASLVVVLITGITMILAGSGGGTFSVSGIVSADGGYGSLVLRGGAGLYVVVGVAAFTAGMALTLVCVRLSDSGKARKKKTIAAETSGDAQGKEKS